MRLISRRNCLIRKLPETHNKSYKQSFADRLIRWLSLTLKRDMGCEAELTNRISVLDKEFCPSYIWKSQSVPYQVLQVRSVPIQPWINEIKNLTVDTKSNVFFQKLRCNVHIYSIELKVKNYRMKRWNNYFFIICLKDNKNNIKILTCLEASSERQDCQAEFRLPKPKDSLLAHRLIKNTV